MRRTARPSSCATSPKSFGAVVALRSGSLGSTPARSTRWSARTAPASRRWSRSSPACTGATRASFRFHGEDVDFGSTAESKAAGIAVIYQEPTLFPDLSVTENIFMGRQPLGRGRRIDRAAMYAEAAALFERLGVAHRPPPPGPRPLHRRPADHRDRQGHLARRQPADHGRADRGAQRRRGRAAVRRRPQPARRGPGLVFISHRFDEVFALCDTVTVMRDGEYVSTHAIAETRSTQIVARMVGREVGDLYPKTPAGSATWCSRSTG